MSPGHCHIIKTTVGWVDAILCAAKGKKNMEQIKLSIVHSILEGASKDNNNKKKCLQLVKQVPSLSDKLLLDRLISSYL